jgi:hypothetical protein
MKREERSRLAADWVPTEEELAAIQAGEETSLSTEFEEEKGEEEADPRYLPGGKFYRYFPHGGYSTDEEEADALQSMRESLPWDPYAGWVRDLIQPAEIGDIPRGKGSRNGKRRRSPVVKVKKQSDRNDDDQAKERVLLYRFQARLSAGEYWFYDVRGDYDLVVVRRYLMEIRENGFDREDRRKRFLTAGIRRMRFRSVYVEEEELKDLRLCPGGAMRALAERARTEQPLRVAAIDRLAKKKLPIERIRRT